jgi:hypothetical protein
MGQQGLPAIVAPGNEPDSIFDFFRDIEGAAGHSDWRARQTARLKLDILASVENAMFPAHAGGPQTRV